MIFLAFNILKKKKIIFFPSCKDDSFQNFFSEPEKYRTHQNTVHTNFIPYRTQKFRYRTSWPS